MELQYAGYTILFLITIGLLISFLPIKGGADKDGENKETNKNDPGV
jgi:hypothetical protein